MRCPTHVHLCWSIPPQSSVAHTIGSLKGKGAVRIHRELLPRVHAPNGGYFPEAALSGPS